MATDSNLTATTPTGSSASLLPARYLNAFRVLAVSLSLVVLLAGTSEAAIAGRQTKPRYEQSVYKAALTQPQQTNCWCVVAATRAMLLHLGASTSVSQAKLSAFMTQHDNDDWTDSAFSGYIRCWRGTPRPSFAHDSRGMAWTLWNRVTPSQTAGYNDYAGTSQSDMDWSIVRGIRATGAPVGVVVAGGLHMILAVGYETRFDPLSDLKRNNQILGVRVWDPWNGAGFGNWSGWPRGGFPGNAFVTIADWNSRYFKPDLHEGDYYKDRYVAVLRSSAAQPPSDTPPISYGDWKLGPSPTPSPSPTPTPSPVPTPSATPTSSPAETPVASATPSAIPSSSPAPDGLVSVQRSVAQLDVPAIAGVYPDISQAITNGLRDNGLLHDPELGDVPADYAAGTSVRVQSLELAMPSYDLVELRSEGVVRAVAVVNETAGGHVFAELWPVTAGFRLPTQSELDARVSALGLRGPASPVWAWTQDSAPAIAPFLAATTASGQTVFVTAEGYTQQLQ